MRRNLIKKGRGERKKKILWFLFSHLEILDREIVYSWAYPFLPNSIPFYDVGWLSPFQKKQGREKNKKRKKRKGGQWKEKWGEKIRGKKKKGGRIDTRVWHEFTCSLYTLGSDLFWIWDFLLSRSVARALGTVVCLRWWPSRNWSRSCNNDTVLYYHCTRWTALHGSLPDRIRNWTRIALLPGHQHPYAAKSNVFLSPSLSHFLHQNDENFYENIIMFVPWENCIRSKDQSILVDNLEYSTIDCVRPTHLPEPRTPRICVRRKGKFNRSWDWLFLSNLYNLYLYLTYRL